MLSILGMDESVFCRFVFVSSGLIEFGEKSIDDSFCSLLDVDDGVGGREKFS